MCSKRPFRRSTWGLVQHPDQVCTLSLVFSVGFEVVCHRNQLMQADVTTTHPFETIEKQKMKMCCILESPFLSHHVRAWTRENVTCKAHCVRMYCVSRKSFGVPWPPAHPQFFSQRCQVKTRRRASCWCRHNRVWRSRTADKKKLCVCNTLHQAGSGLSNSDHALTLYAEPPPKILDSPAAHPLHQTSELT